jgi:hypothetical protein
MVHAKSLFVIVSSVRATYSNWEVGAVQVITSDAILSITKSGRVAEQGAPGSLP